MLRSLKQFLLSLAFSASNPPLINYEEVWQSFKQKSIMQIACQKIPNSKKLIKQTFKDTYKQGAITIFQKASAGTTLGYYIIHEMQTEVPGAILKHWSSYPVKEYKKLALELARAEEQEDGFSGVDLAQQIASSVCEVLWSDVQRGYPFDGQYSL